MYCYPLRRSIPAVRLKNLTVQCSDEPKYSTTNVVTIPLRGKLRLPGSLCYPERVMGIPNVKRLRITGPEGQQATLMAVLPKGADLQAYVEDAGKRFDWKAWQEVQQKQFKIRVGQQKQKKAK
jgi:hypothetical protein